MARRFSPERAATLATLVVAAGILTRAQTTSPGPVLAAELFDSQSIQRIDLRVNSIDWEKLKADLSASAREGSAHAAAASRDCAWT
jgi:hypothetical protein